MKSNSLLLRSVIRSYLNEADAYTKKFGKRFDQSAEVESYVGVIENEIVKYAVRMTGTAKLGINPGYSFDNPRGIYAYPLNLRNFNQLINNSLPYVSDAANFVIFEIKNTEKWLDVGSKTKHKDWKDICNVMIQYTNSAYNKDVLFQDVLNEAKKGLHWSISSGAKIYDFGYALTKFFPESKMSSIWQSILLNAGFEGVYDPGKGVLHESEPAQLVALKLSAIKQINMYDTNAFRKGTTPVEVHSKNINREYTKEEIKKMSYKEKYQIIVNNKNTKLSNLLLFARDKDIEVRNILAGSDKATTEIFEILANDPSPRIKIVVVMNPKVPKDIMLKLMEEFVGGNLDQKRFLAGFSKTPANILKKLENDPDCEGALASNPNSSADFLLKASKSKNFYLRINVAINESTPLEALRELTVDENAIVRKYAQQTLDKLSL